MVVLNRTDIILSQLPLGQLVVLRPFGRLDDLLHLRDEDIRLLYFILQRLHITIYLSAAVLNSRLPHPCRLFVVVIVHQQHLQPHSTSLNVGHPMFIVKRGAASNLEPVLRMLRSDWSRHHMIFISMPLLKLKSTFTRSDL